MGFQVTQSPRAEAISHTYFYLCRSFVCAGVCARALMPWHEGGGQGRQGLTATATGIADLSIQEGSQSPLPILL